jgi:hypothetical protein
MRKLRSYLRFAADAEVPSGCSLRRLRTRPCALASSLPRRGSCPSGGSISSRVPTVHGRRLVLKNDGLADSSRFGCVFLNSLQWDCDAQPTGRVWAACCGLACASPHRGRAGTRSEAHKRWRNQACAIPTQKNPDMGRFPRSRFWDVPFSGRQAGGRRTTRFTGRVAARNMKRKVFHATTRLAYAAYRPKRS